MRLPAALSVFRHRPYARYALCRFSASLAWQMFAVAVGWQVYALTRDPLALGFVGLAEFIPFVCLVLVGGYVADHVDRRKILLAMWTTDMLGLTSVCLLTLAHVRVVWPIYLAIAVFGATRSFWQPSLQALVPNLVPIDEFPRALSVNSMLFQTAAILGPALGGLLFLLGPEVVFGSCAGLFALIIVVGSGLPPQRAGQRCAGELPQQNADGRFLDGLRYVLHHRAVLGVISLDLFAVLFGGATALLPIYASDVLHIGPPGLGLLRTAPSVGAAITAVVLTLRPINRHAGAVMFAGVGLFGVCTLIFGESRSFVLSLAALCVLGAGDMLSVYIRGMLVQLRTPDAIRGRVSAISSMFIGASNELGEFESGVTARWFGAVRAVLLGGVLTLGVVASWIGLFPELRKLDKLR
ncbi:MAG TPA: MFS transporter [Steroidobacteraceae bacterium]|nr:MFS transporter [Steroidobacteraceae bacterium]